MSDVNTLEKRLDSHPELKKHVLKLLDLTENMDIIRADDIEMEVTKVIPSLARQAIEEWAISQEAKSTQSFSQAQEQSTPNVKKNSTGVRLTGSSNSRNKPSKPPRV